MRYKVIGIGETVELHVTVSKGGRWDFVIESHQFVRVRWWNWIVRRLLSRKSLFSKRFSSESRRLCTTNLRLQPVLFAKRRSVTWLEGSKRCCSQCFFYPPISIALPTLSHVKVQRGPPPPNQTVSHSFQFSSHFSWGSYSTLGAFWALQFRFW